MIDFDVILDHVGNFGRYQIKLCSVTFYLTIFSSMHVVAPVFYAPSMPFRCKFPHFENKKLFYNDILNLTTPFESRTMEYDTCRRYAFNESSCNTTDCVDRSLQSSTCVDGYVFEKSQFVETTISQWELVCDRKYLNALETSLFFVGAMVGGLAVGYYGDRFGRKLALLSCCLGNIIFGVIASQVPWYPAFVVARFFVGVCSIGIDFMTEVYIMEVTGRKHTTAFLLDQSAAGIAWLFNSLFSYFIRDWRYFYLAVSLFGIPYIAFYFVIPESPRWYFSACRNEIGKQLANKFATHNKKNKTINEAIWKNAETQQKEMENSTQKYSVLDLFKQPKIRLVTIHLNICSFIVDMVVIGMSLNVGSLSGNIFLNNAVNGIIVVVSSLCFILIINRIDRHILLGLSLILTSIASLSCFFVIFFGGDIPGLATAGVVLSFVAYLGCCASSLVLEMYSAELYPTVVRSNGLGLMSLTGGVGSILAPIVISTSLQWIPYIVFGVLSIIAGISGLRLPETINRPMPDTLEEAESLYRGKPISRLSTRRPHTEVSTISTM